MLDSTKSCAKVGVFSKKIDINQEKYLIVSE